MNQRRTTGLAAALILAMTSACSGGSQSAPVTAPEEPVVQDTTATTIEQTTTVASPVFSDGPLAEVCNDTIVVQAAGLPQIGVGPLYALLDSSPEIDVELGVVSSPLTRIDGTVEGVTLEIRSGGPGVGFRSPIALMHQDPSIDLAIGSLAVAVRDRTVLATTAVAGSDGGPASFVAAAGIEAQQGDLAFDAALLPSLEQWNQAVVALPAFEAGWLSIDDLVLVDATEERISPECLGRLVPVIQEAIAGYATDPAATNETMSAIREELHPLARATPELLDSAMELALAAGVFDASGSSAPGTIGVDGLDNFLTELATALGVEAVAVADVIDSGYLDPTIER